MAEMKKQDVRMIFKIGGFLAFIMLGYLGIRSYKQSVEKLKINPFISSISITFFLFCSVIILLSLDYLSIMFVLH